MHKNHRRSFVARQERKSYVPKAMVKYDAARARRASTRNTLYRILFGVEDAEGSTYLDRNIHGSNIWNYD